MSLEFKYYKIDDIGEVVSGGTPSTSKNEYWYGDIGWITPKDLSTYEGIYISRGERNISFEGLNNSSARLLPKNTVLMTSRAPIGYIAIANNELSTNQGFKSLICDEEICYYKYFYYWLKLNIKYIINNANGSTFNEISGGTFKNLEISLPSITEQKAISSVLWTLDEKISVLKRINKNLFNIIDVIFKVYVGDYEDLEIVPLSENTKEIIRGFNSKYVEKSNIKNFNQKVNKGTFLEKQHFKYLDENIEIPKVKFAKKRDVLLNSLGDGTVGRPHYYNEDTDNVVVDQHITIIRANEDLIPSTYIYEYLKNSTGQYHLDSLISGSTGMLMLNISEIRNLKIPILDKKNLREFDTTVTPLFDKITKNFEEIYELSKLRDTLLPKLMSGEIDVSKINCDI